MFDWVEFWPLSLDELVARAPRDWQLLQLSYFHTSVYRDQALRDNEDGLWLPGALLAGTFVYMIRRADMAEIIRRHVDLASGRFLVSGTQPELRVYRCSLPLLSYEGLDSSIHPEHLDEHNRHREWAERMHREGRYRWPLS